MDEDAIYVEKEHRKKECLGKDNEFRYVENEAICEISRQSCFAGI